MPPDNIPVPICFGFVRCIFYSIRTNASPTGGPNQINLIFQRIIHTSTVTEWLKFGKPRVKPGLFRERRHSFGLDLPAPVTLQEPHPNPGDREEKRQKA